MRLSAVRCWPSDASRTVIHSRPHGAKSFRSGCPALGPHASRIVFDPADQKRKHTVQRLLLFGLQPFQRLDPPDQRLETVIRGFLGGLHGC